MSHVRSSQVTPFVLVSATAGTTEHLLRLDGSPDRSLCGLFDANQLHPAVDYPRLPTCRNCTKAYRRRIGGEP